MVESGKDTCTMGSDALSLLLHGYRTQQQEEEDEEELQELADDWSKSAEVCSACGDALHYTEEVVQLQIFMSYRGPNNEVVLVPVQDDEGDFAYEPQYLEFDCWESLTEDLKSMIEDEPPVGHPRELLECSYCKSSICEWEIFATSYVGELHVSRRCPDNTSTSTFAAMSTPYVTCLSCLLFQSYECDLWTEELSQTGECEECSHARCWREQGCSCPCHAGRSD